MRRKIVSILEQLGIRDDFIIGNGAKYSTSEIHFKIDSKSPRLDGKQYAIQFEKETQTLAVWELRERLALSASLDLYAQSNFTWSSVTKIFDFNIAIGRKNSGRFSKVVIMPFSQFEVFLRFNNEFGFTFDIDNSEFENDDYQSVDIVGSSSEGRTVYYYGKRYERNRYLRETAIKIQGYECKICGFDFEKFYGTVGHEYIEVHHIRPLCEGEQTPDPKNDLIVVCSNCHKMIHRNKNRTLSPTELREYIKGMLKNIKH